MNAPHPPSVRAGRRVGIAARLSGRARPVGALAMLLAAVALVVFSGGCGTPRRGEARRLLESIAKSNRRIGIALTQFSDVIASRLEDKASKEDAIEGLKKLKAAFGPLRKGIDDWIVPKSPEAQSLVDTYRAYLDKREANFNEFAPQIVEVVTTQTVPLRDRPKAVQEIVAKLNKLDADAIAGLKAAQRAYAASVGVFAYE